MISNCKPEAVQACLNSGQPFPLWPRRDILLAEYFLPLDSNNYIIFKGQQILPKPEPAGGGWLFPFKAHQPGLTPQPAQAERFEEDVFAEDTARLAIIDGAHQEKQADPAAPPMQHQLPQQ